MHETARPRESAYLIMRPFQFGKQNYMLQDIQPVLGTERPEL